VRLLAKIRHRINQLLISTGFQIERSNLYLPFDFPVSKIYLKVPYHLRATNDFILRFSPNCDALIDVGANRGSFTELFIRINEDCKKYLFEPIPELFNYLNSNLKKLNNIKIFNYAVSDSIAESKFHVAANDGQSSSLLPIGERHRIAAPHALELNQIEVKVATLDSLLDGEKFENAFLKIDVQGAELQVLLGAMNTLKRTNAVHIEVSIQSLYDGDTIGYEIWKILHHAGFTLYGMDPWFRDPKSNGELLQCDLFFVKNFLLKNSLKNNR
jgi:FkbM family methyltransferase